MLLLTVLFVGAVSGRRLVRVRRVPAWRSATIGVEGADSYTAFGYANPTRRVLVPWQDAFARLGLASHVPGVPRCPSTSRQLTRWPGHPPGPRTRPPAQAGKARSQT